MDLVHGSVGDKIDNKEEKIDIKEEKIYIKEEKIDIKEDKIDIKEEKIYIKEEKINIKEDKIDIKEDKIDIKEEKMYIKENKIDIKEEKIDINEEKIDPSEEDDNKLKIKDELDVDDGSFCANNSSIICKSETEDIEFMEIKIEGYTKETDEKIENDPEIEKHFKCSKCQDTFDTKAMLNNHRLEWHPVKTRLRRKKPFRFSCAICNDIFTFKTNLVKHLLHRHKIVVFPCDLCPKMFSEKEQLHSHISTHATEKVPSQISKKTSPKIRDRKLLSYGVQKQSLNRKNGKFPCVLCGKIFAFKSFLKHHESRVHNFQYYEIIPSGASTTSFPSKSRLEQHQLTQSQKDMFPCKLCGLFLMNNVLLEKHMKEHAILPEDNLKFRPELCRKTYSRKKE